MLNGTVHIYFWNIHSKLKGSLSHVFPMVNWKEIKHEIIVPAKIDGVTLNQ